MQGLNIILLFKEDIIMCTFQCRYVYIVHLYIGSKVIDLGNQTGL